MTRLLIALLLASAPALARDPITGIEDSQDLMKARLAADRGKHCTVPHVRGANGKVRQVRDRNEVAKFRAHFPCPSTEKRTGACPGWVVDHVVALHHCGPDKSTNMAWQSVEDAKAKDRWE